MVNEIPATFIPKSLTPCVPTHFALTYFQRLSVYPVSDEDEVNVVAMAAVMPPSSRDRRTWAAKLTGSSGD